MVGFISSIDSNLDMQEENIQTSWEQIVGFMRNNPKLLMQMIPGEE